MDTNKMRDISREQFEAWVLSEYPNQIMDRFINGEYRSTTVEHCWLSWQVSREAVVVELPEPDLPEAYIDEPVDRESEDFRYLEARHGAQCQIYRKCRKAIEAQGLKVAP